MSLSRDALNGVLVLFRCVSRSRPFLLDQFHRSRPDTFVLILIGQDQWVDLSRGCGLHPRFQGADSGTHIRRAEFFGHPCRHDQGGQWVCRLSRWDRSHSCRGVRGKSHGTRCLGDCCEEVGLWRWTLLRKRLTTTRPEVRYVVRGSWSAGGQTDQQQTADSQSFHGRPAASDPTLRECRPHRNLCVVRSPTVRISNQRASRLCSRSLKIFHEDLQNARFS